MTTHPLVSEFYRRVWDDGERAALDELVTDDFRFQGSLGAPMIGRDAFWEMVKIVRTALSDYKCTIVDCVTEPEKAFARMRFAGLHVGHFRGVEPTGRRVEWQGAALFSFAAERICAIWVLSDTAMLDTALRGADM